jgi:pectinesterase
MKNMIMLAGILCLCSVFAEAKDPAVANPVAKASAFHADIVVAADGSGQFKTVQEAVKAAPANRTVPFVIFIKPGTYQGPVSILKDKPNLALVGSDAEKTIITHSLNVNDPVPAGSDKFNPCLLIRADNFRAEKLTFQNTAGDRGQALAVRADADRAIFTDCRFLGWQDTLMVNNGRDYFLDCHIEGRVDFIYGSATAWFKHCRIHSKNGGYVTAASTPKDHPYGFVFVDCHLTGDPAPWIDASGKPVKKSSTPPVTFLGRPWTAEASVTYLNCEMDKHIAPAGWDNWRKPEREKTARYAECNSRGPGANPGKRAAWSKQLTAAEAGRITVEAVLGGKDGWRPEAGKSKK